MDELMKILIDDDDVLKKYWNDMSVRKPESWERQKKIKIKFLKMYVKHLNEFCTAHESFYFPQFRNLLSCHWQTFPVLWTSHKVIKTILSQAFFWLLFDVLHGER